MFTQEIAALAASSPHLVALRQAVQDQWRNGASQSINQRVNLVDAIESGGGGGQQQAQNPPTTTTPTGPSSSPEDSSSSIITTTTTTAPPQQQFSSLLATASLIDKLILLQDLYHWCSVSDVTAKTRIYMSAVALCNNEHREDLFGGRGGSGHNASFSVPPSTADGGQRQPQQSSGAEAVGGTTTNSQSSSSCSGFSFPLDEKILIGLTISCIADGCFFPAETQVGHVIVNFLAKFSVFWRGFLKQGGASAALPTVSSSVEISGEGPEGEDNVNSRSSSQPVVVEGGIGTGGGVVVVVEASSATIVAQPQQHASLSDFVQICHLLVNQLATRAHDLLTTSSSSTSGQKKSKNVISSYVMDEILRVSYGVVALLLGSSSSNSGSSAAAVMMIMLPILTSPFQFNVVEDTGGVEGGGGGGPSNNNSNNEAEGGGSSSAKNKTLVGHDDAGEKRGGEERQQQAITTTTTTTIHGAFHSLLLKILSLKMFEFCNGNGGTAGLLTSPPPPIITSCSSWSSPTTVGVILENSNALAETPSSQRRQLHRSDGPCFHAMSEILSCFQQALVSSNVEAAAEQQPPSHLTLAPFLLQCLQEVLLSDSLLFRKNAQISVINNNNATLDVINSFACLVVANPAAESSTTTTTSSLLLSAVKLPPSSTQLAMLLGTLYITEHCLWFFRVNHLHAKASSSSSTPSPLNILTSSSSSSAVVVDEVSLILAASAIVCALKRLVASMVVTATAAAATTTSSSSRGSTTSSSISLGYQALLWEEVLSIIEAALVFVPLPPLPVAAAVASSGSTTSAATTIASSSSSSSSSSLSSGGFGFTLEKLLCQIVTLMVNAEQQLRYSSNNGAVATTYYGSSGNEGGTVVDGGVSSPSQLDVVHPESQHQQPFFIAGTSCHVLKTVLDRLDRSLTPRVKLQILCYLLTVYHRHHSSSSSSSSDAMSNTAGGTEAGGTTTTTEKDSNTASSFSSDSVGIRSSDGGFIYFGGGGGGGNPSSGGHIGNKATLLLDKPAIDASLDKFFNLYFRPTLAATAPKTFPSAGSGGGQTAAAAAVPSQLPPWLHVLQWTCQTILDSTLFIGSPQNSSSSTSSSSQLRVPNPATIGIMAPLTAHFVANFFAKLEWLLFVPPVGLDAEKVSESLVVIIEALRLGGSANSKTNEGISSSSGDGPSLLAHSTLVHSPLQTLLHLTACPEIVHASLASFFLTALRYLTSGSSDDDGDGNLSGGGEGGLIATIANTVLKDCILASFFFMRSNNSSSSSGSGGASVSVAAMLQGGPAQLLCPSLAKVMLTKFPTAFNQQLRISRTNTSSCRLMLEFLRPWLQGRVDIPLCANGSSSGSNVNADESNVMIASLLLSVSSSGGPPLLQINPVCSKALRNVSLVLLSHLEVVPGRQHRLQMRGPLGDDAEKDSINANTTSKDQPGGTGGGQQAAIERALNIAMTYHIKPNEVALSQYIQDLVIGLTPFLVSTDGEYVDLCLYSLRYLLTNFQPYLRLRSPPVKKKVNEGGDSSSCSVPTPDKTKQESTPDKKEEGGGVGGGGEGEGRPNESASNNTNPTTASSSSSSTWAGQYAYLLSSVALLQASKRSALYSTPRSETRMTLFMEAAHAVFSSLVSVCPMLSQPSRGGGGNKGGRRSKANRKQGTTEGAADGVLENDDDDAKKKEKPSSSTAATAVARENKLSPHEGSRPLFDTMFALVGELAAQFGSLPSAVIPSTVSLFSLAYFSEYRLSASTLAAAASTSSSSTTGVGGNNRHSLFISGPSLIFEAANNYDNNNNNKQQSSSSPSSPPIIATGQNNNNPVGIQCLLGILDLPTSYDLPSHIIYHILAFLHQIAAFPKIFRFFIHQATTTGGTGGGGGGSKIHAHNSSTSMEFFLLKCLEFCLRYLRPGKTAAECFMAELVILTWTTEVSPLLRHKAMSEVLLPFHKGMLAKKAAMAAMAAKESSSTASTTTTTGDHHHQNQQHHGASASDAGGTPLSVASTNHSHFAAANASSSSVPPPFTNSGDVLAMVLRYLWRISYAGTYDWTPHVPAAIADRFYSPSPISTTAAGGNNFGGAPSSSSPPGSSASSPSSIVVRHHYSSRTWCFNDMLVTILRSPFAQESIIVCRSPVGVLCFMTSMLNKMMSFAPSQRRGNFFGMMLEDRGNNRQQTVHYEDDESSSSSSSSSSATGGSSTSNSDNENEEKDQKGVGVGEGGGANLSRSGSKSRRRHHRHHQQPSVHIHRECDSCGMVSSIKAGLFFVCEDCNRETYCVNCWDVQHLHRARRHHVKQPVDVPVNLLLLAASTTGPPGGGRPGLSPAVEQQGSVSSNTTTTAGGGGGATTASEGGAPSPSPSPLAHLPPPPPPRGSSNASLVETPLLATPSSTTSVQSTSTNNTNTNRMPTSESQGDLSSPSKQAAGGGHTPAGTTLTVPPPQQQPTHQHHSFASNALKKVRSLMHLDGGGHHHQQQHSTVSFVSGAGGGGGSTNDVTATTTTSSGANKQHQGGGGTNQDGSATAATSSSTPQQQLNNTSGGGGGGSKKVGGADEGGGANNAINRSSGSTVSSSSSPSHHHHHHLHAPIYTDPLMSLDTAFAGFFLQLFASRLGNDGGIDGCGLANPSSIPAPLNSTSEAFVRSMLLLDNISVTETRKAGLIYVPPASAMRLAPPSDVELLSCQTPSNFFWAVAEGLGTIQGLYRPDLKPHAARSGSPTGWWMPQHSPYTGGIPLIYREEDISLSDYGTHYLGYSDTFQEIAFHTGPLMAYNCGSGVHAASSSSVGGGPPSSTSTTDSQFQQQQQQQQSTTTNTTSRDPTGMKRKRYIGNDQVVVIVSDVPLACGYQELATAFRSEVIEVYVIVERLQGEFASDSSWNASTLSFSVGGTSSADDASSSSSSLGTRCDGVARITLVLGEKASPIYASSIRRGGGGGQTQQQQQSSSSFFSLFNKPTTSGNSSSNTTTTDKASSAPPTQQQQQHIVPLAVLPQYLFTLVSHLCVLGKAASHERGHLVMNWVARIRAIRNIEEKNAPS